LQLLERDADQSAQFLLRHAQFDPPRLDPFADMHVHVRGAAFCPSSGPLRRFRRHFVLLIALITTIVRESGAFYATRTARQILYAQNRE
jgi:hypothetical protein